jgi:hypothetical protein
MTSWRIFFAPHDDTGIIAFALITFYNGRFFNELTYFE